MRRAIGTGVTRSPVDSNFAAGATVCCRWPNKLVCACWVLTATVLLLLRQKGVASYNTLWAEDGREFLSDALGAPMASLFRPFAGYLHTIPRLIGLGAAAAGLNNAALAFSAGSAFVVALMSLYVFFASGSVLESTWLRAGLAGSIVLLPAGGYEVSNNATNLHWYLMFGCFWALLDRSTAKGRRFGGAVMVLAATLSSPITALLFPLAVWQYFRRGSLKDRQVVLTYAAGLVAQIAVVAAGLLWPRDDLDFLTSYAGNDFSEIPRLYGLGVSQALLVSDRLLGETWLALGWGLGHLCTLLFVGLTVAVSIRHPRSQVRVIAPACLILAMSVFGLTVAVRGSNAVDTVGQQIALLGNRYVVLPMLFLVTIVVIAVDRWAGSTGRRRTQACFSALLLLVFSASFRVTNLRSGGPSWPESVEVARGKCLSGQETVRISEAPGGEAAGWFVELPCRAVDE
ncbi:MAG: hypothetical protein ACT4OM_05230 [Actinomycetota bacterium]